MSSIPSVNEATHGSHESSETLTPAQRLAKKVKESPDGISMERDGVEYHLMATDNGFLLTADVLDDNSVIQTGTDDIATINGCNRYELVFDPEFTLPQEITLFGKPYDKTIREQISLMSYLSRFINSLLYRLLDEKYIDPIVAEPKTEDKASSLLREYKIKAREACAENNKRKKTSVQFADALERSFKFGSPIIDAYNKLVDVSSGMALEPSSILLSDNLWKNMLQYPGFSTTAMRIQLIEHLLGRSKKSSRSELEVKLEELKAAEENHKNGPVSIGRLATTPDEEVSM